ncbi:MAG: NADP-dependent phosphogluconate dehydrogenase [Acidobacteriia bacterium]|nr:NADP-dependent phosphogluconate dehydrogenase [Terriglobia bacterium]MYG02306.1 NADP-dependent phosphogluconate dehydrogenase [Terriglobia bacterium]MYK10533.1 NADP-dependent phosphogluconate dehydrogenase [Terriglobia bacterium]
MSADNFGVAGLGVMGRNVALNIERNGFPVIAYNRGDENAQRMRDESVGKNVTVTQSIEELVSLLDPPRRVLLMVTAGAGTDRVIDALLEHLGPGDVLIDGGNSHFPDTDRRAKRLQQAGLHFVGCGISGGEEGALWGPSIMPGGNFEAYERIAPVLEKIAAKTDDDGACVTYCGRHAAGHYVKMVHNGIEYGIMQLICEVYDILRRAAGMSTEQIQEVFQEWTTSPKVGGFLVDITAQCLAKSDDQTGDPLVEKILDTAGQKGTGKWTAQTALDLGVPIPTLSQAVNARILSGLKQARVEASGVLTGPGTECEQDRERLVATLHSSLHLAMVASYAQGLHLIQTASKEYDFGTDLAEVARIWKDGCIIRSRLLDPIKQAYKQEPEMENMLLHPSFSAIVNESLQDLREAVEIANRGGVATTCLGATLAYLDSYRSEFLPANLLQALRDNFGAHTYRRLDMDGVFHTQWNR